MNILVSFPFVAFLEIASSATAVSFEVAGGHSHSCALFEHDVKCWGHNNNGQLGVGNTEALWSPLAEPLDLGEGFDPIAVHCGGFYSCAVSTGGSTKCWGQNTFGQLGVGSNSNLGDGGNEMGDNLPAIEWGSDFELESMCTGSHHSCALSTNAVLKCVGYNNKGQLGIGTTINQNSPPDAGVDLGGNFEAVQLECGAAHSCARSAGGDLKCWGYNLMGQLGQGDNSNIGDATGELGDNLKAIDLGTGFEIKTLEVGQYHSCAISTDGDLKCWGYNGNGQLGYGDTNHRGDNANELGDNLPTVDLGTDFAVSDVAAGSSFTCATSTSGTMKCWGQNSYGQLGQGNTTQIGDDSNEMGDYLEETDIGSGFTASGWRLPTRFGAAHAFVFEASTSGPQLKCWGYNSYGQCGYGDTENRGDARNEMGDFLDFVDLGFTMPPTPTPADCIESNMSSVNWDDLLNVDGTGDSLLHSSSVEFAASSLSLTLSVELEYVGLSADGNFDSDYNLGTSYWIDFQSFGESIDSINEAGSCGNRRSDDYDGLAFSEYWGYTADPQDLEGSPNALRMAYPSSEWNLDALDCNAVRYERTFSWTELRACTDEGGDSLVAVTQTDSTILLRGTFFVELVSPYSMSSSDYYRSYPLVQQDFVVALSRSVNVMASTGVQLFIISVMAFGRDEDGRYEMTILVQSADFVELAMDDPVAVLSVPDALTVGAVETVAAECLVASSFTCGQIFTVTIPAECPSDDSVVDLGGDWQFAFTPQCRTADDTAACDTFMADLGESGKVALDLTSSFQDDCAVNLFNVTFEGNLTFYSDSSFSQIANDSFVIGQDTIYGEVVVDYLADEDGAEYEFLNVSVETVYVCTSPDADTLAATLNSDGVAGVGGCLSTQIDGDGPYIVIGDGAGNYSGSTAYADSGSDRARFSFLTFDTPRTTMSVHVQLLLTLLTETGSQRRRMLLEVDSFANQLEHFLDTVTTAAAAPRTTAPSASPTKRPTPLCLNLKVDIIGTPGGLQKGDFEGLYLFAHSQSINSRPLFESPLDRNDRHIQYVGVPPNGFWVIEGTGKGTLSYGPTAAYYPPYDEVSYGWTHNDASAETADILIGCVESVAPSNAPTFAPTADPTDWSVADGEGEMAVAAGGPPSDVESIVVLTIGGAVAVAVVVAVLLLLARRRKTSERADCEQHSATMPAANLAQHIAAQSSTV